MPKLPRVSGKDTVKALNKIGFEKTSQKGSHMKLKRVELGKTITVTVPDHRVLKPGTLKNGILNTIPLSVEEFVKLLKK